MTTFGLEKNYPPMGWVGLQALISKKYICGHCNHKVSSSLGYKVAHSSSSSNNATASIYICTECTLPTFFDPSSTQFPSSITENLLKNIPDNLNSLLNEARISASLGAYTASVLCCRKMLMNIAVEHGDEEGKNFFSYVEFLSEKGFIPPNGKEWVNYIRTKGNEANHEIALMKESDAKTLLAFVEMLMKFIFEFPSMIPSK